MGKGIVMEIGQKDLTVMTADGLFLKSKFQRHAKVGEEIEIVPLVSNHRTWGIRTLASAAACAMIAFGAWTYSNATADRQVFAYVSVDINPSIELGVNQSGIVLTSNAINDDGQTVLRAISVNGELASKAIEKIEQTAASDGFVHQDSDIVITTSLARAKTSTNQSSSGKLTPSSIEDPKLAGIQQTILAAAQDSLKTIHSTAQVQAFEVSSQFHDAALALGLSPAKYAFYLKANQAGYPVTVQELAKSNRYAISKKYSIPQNLLRDSTENSLNVAMEQAADKRKTPLTKDDDQKSVVASNEDQEQDQKQNENQKASADKKNQSDASENQEKKKGNQEQERKKVKSYLAENPSSNPLPSTNQQDLNDSKQKKNEKGDQKSKHDEREPIVKGGVFHGGLGQVSSVIISQES